MRTFTFLSTEADFAAAEAEYLSIQSKAQKLIDEGKTEEAKLELEKILVDITITVLGGTRPFCTSLSKISPSINEQVRIRWYHLMFETLLMRSQLESVVSERDWLWGDKGFAIYRMIFPLFRRAQADTLAVYPYKEILERNLNEYRTVAALRYQPIDDAMEIASNDDKQSRKSGKRARFKIDDKNEVLTVLRIYDTNTDLAGNYYAPPPQPARTPSQWGFSPASRSYSSIVDPTYHSLPIGTAAAASALPIGTAAAAPVLPIGTAGLKPSPPVRDRTTGAGAHDKSGFQLPAAPSIGLVRNGILPSRPKTTSITTASTANNKVEPKSPLILRISLNKGPWGD